MSREQRITDEEGRVLLKSLTQPELAEWLTQELGEKPFRAKQIWRWLYVALVSDFEEMTDISKDLRAKLQEKARIDTISLHDERIAQDRSEEHTSELQSRGHLVCRLLLEKKN